MGKFRKSRGRNRSLGKKRTLRGGAGEETTPDPRSLSFDDMVRQGLSLEYMVKMYVDLYTEDFPLAPAEEIQRFKKLTRDQFRAAEKKRKREKLIRQVAQRDYEQALAAGVLSPEEVEDLKKRSLVQHKSNASKQEVVEKEQEGSLVVVLALLLLLLLPMSPLLVGFLLVLRR